MTSETNRRLVIFSNVTVIPTDNGRLMIKGRAISGAEAHGRYWDGKVVCVCEPASARELLNIADRNRAGDNVEVHPSELPFELIVADFTSDAARQAVASATVAMVGVGHRATHFAKWGKELGVAIIYGTEYTIATRLQIARTEVRNPLRLLRRILWELGLERKQRAAIAMAAGVHCNGTPTYDAYLPINPNAMLFYDGRMDDDMLAPPVTQAARHDRLRRREPLRLAWSGRMIKMKGAHLLAPFASELKKLGIPFHLEIFGGGALEKPVRDDVQARGLADCVDVKGYVNFYDELTPHMQREVDIWICPHPQGDPSGAYIETFGNGLPIIGYANEALAGMLRRVDAGRTVPIGDAKALAAAVAAADTDRELVVRWSQAALDFAADNTFYKSFERRMIHIDKLLAAKGG
jgi:colanic acid/amylovoran biosynthesis glycosyltransferase